MMNQPHTTTIPVFTIREVRRMARRQLSGKWLSTLPAMLIFVLLVSLPGAAVQLCTYLTGDFTAILGETQNIPDPLAGQLQLGTENIGRLSSFSLLLSLYLFIVSGPFSMSLASLSLRILRNKEYSAKTIFSGFSEFGKGFLTYLLITVVSFLWTMLFMIPGSMFLGAGLLAGSPFISVACSLLFFIVIISLLIFLMRYEIAYFIAADTNTGAREAVGESVRLMRGNVSNYFLLMLSFLPWIILTAVPVSLSLVTFFRAVTEGSAIFSAVSVVLALIAIVFYAFLTLYMKTTSAVFYSGITGNFRAAAADTDSTAEGSGEGE